MLVAAPPGNAANRPIQAAVSQSASELFKTFQPEVAALDIGLPVMTGDGLAQRLSALADQPFRLVALTGHAQSEDCACSLQAGCDVHPVKPLKRSALVDAIAAADRPMTSGPDRR